MNQRIAQLESLLSRVQQRAQEPRAPRVVAAPAAAAETLVTDEVSPGVESLNDTSAEIVSVPASSSETRPQSLAVEEAPLSASSVRAGLQEEPELEEMDLSAPDAAEAFNDPLESENIAASAEQPSASEASVGLGAPTMEQLGETVVLEEGPAAQFELDAPDMKEEPAQQASTSETAELESQEASFDTAEELAEEELLAESQASVSAAGGGNFDENLSAPPGARAELDRVLLGEVKDVPASVSERPVLSTNVVEFIDAAQEFKPASFAELLEASLQL